MVVRSAVHTNAGAMSHMESRTLVYRTWGRAVVWKFTHYSLVGQGQGWEGMFTQHVFHGTAPS